MSRLDKPLTTTPEDLLKKMLALENEHNSLVDIENSAHKRRGEIVSTILGIKEILSHEGIDIEKELDRLRKVNSKNLV